MQPRMHTRTGLVFTFARVGCRNIVQVRMPDPWVTFWRHFVHEERQCSVNDLLQYDTVAVDVPLLSTISGLHR